jgi:mycoredoxin
MDEQSSNKITLYTYRWCAHAISVEHFLKMNDIPVERISVDGDDEAREELIALNGGYASVPTLIFPDGSKLTEPSHAELRHKLNLEPPPGLMERLRGLMSQDSDI